MKVSLQKKTLKVDVLLNSPGVHDEVRIRRPYSQLQRAGIDCLVHERPFRMRQCIRGDSIVVWQRPLAESREMMIENFFWLSQRNCILLVDLDDHPGLFDARTKQEMMKQKFANLEFSHGIITSNGYLANELRKYNQSIFTVDNCIGQQPKLNLTKHIKDRETKKTVRILIANQNRKEEHERLIQSLKQLLRENTEVHLEVVADEGLANSLPEERVTSYPRLSYKDYRKVLSECHIALAPLNISNENECKTVIKWQECTAESVVLVGGPEMYGKTLSGKVGLWIKSFEELIPATDKLIKDRDLRVRILMKARDCLEKNGWTGHKQTIWHSWLMATLWKKRNELDYYAKKRLSKQMSTKEIAKYGGYLR